MQYIDSHSHLYLPEFDDDRDEVISRALNNGIEKILLPNIDNESIKPMLDMTKKYPGICYPMAGLHPTHIKEDYNKQLQSMKQLAEKGGFIAIGEIGIDLYWDKTFIKEQKKAFRSQLELSLELNLPVVIHCRDSFSEIIDIINEFRPGSLKGVFHAFTGTKEEADIICEMGFYIGVGGIITFKNSKLDEVIKEINIDKIILETDSPYLSPVPKRGKRNESANIVYIAEKIAEIKGLTIPETAKITYHNTMTLFKINNS